MLDKTRDLKVVADEAFKLHAGDDDAMHQYILRNARKDAEIMREIVAKGIDETIRHQYSINRRAGSREPVSEEEREETIRKVERTRQFFWDRYTLFGHQPVGNANEAELRESAANRRKQAETSLRRAKFEIALADAIAGTGKTVRKALKLAKVIELAEKYHAS